MINLDGTQTVNDIRKSLDMPEGAMFCIHLEYGGDIHGDLKDARECYVVYRMRIEQIGKFCVVHFYNY